VNSADFSIGQFSYLLRLLLVHGAWNYARISNVILYSFYKNITLYVIELWFAIYSYWTGQVIYERWSIGMYNIFFTFFPPLALGIFDKTCSAETREKNPALYLISQNSELYNIKRFWMFIGNALYHSVLLFWLCKWAMDTGVLWLDGHTDGYLVLGNTVYTMVVITTCLKAALLMDSWNYISKIFIWGSIAVWFVYLISYSHFWPTIKFVASNMPRMYQLMFSSPVYWVLLIFVPVATIGLDFIIAYLKFQYLGSEADRLKRAEKEGNKNDLESTTQSNGGFQVRPSLMGEMSKKVNSNVEPKGVTAKRESLPLEDMPTPERPARSVRGRTGPSTPNSEANVALLGQTPTTTSPNQARAEFFKDLQSKDQTS
jgi:phospholipid-transporting ATPase